MLVFFSCSKKKTDNSPVLARVGNQTLKLKNITNPNLLTSQAIPPLVEEWINKTILYNEAKKEGLDKDSFFIKSKNDFFRDLVISSFVEKTVRAKIKIEKDSILNYYKKNKSSFLRLNEEVYVDHYATENLSTAKKIKEVILSSGEHKKNFDLSLYFVESKNIKKGRLSPVLNNKIFNSQSKAVGPIKTDSSYHVFNILNKYKKGTIVGFDLAYDEIYQRLYKKEETKHSFLLLDSLKNKLKIFINPDYQ